MSKVFKILSGNFLVDCVVDTPSYDLQALWRTHAEPISSELFLLRMYSYEVFKGHI